MAFSQGSQLPKTINLIIKSFELQNVSYQEIEVDNLRSLLDIQLQGDEIYLYAQVRESLPNVHDDQSIVVVVILRNGEQYNPNDPHINATSYQKTIVVKDTAYHFFLNHNLNK